jgi:hypothetical protein
MERTEKKQKEIRQQETKQQKSFFIVVIDGDIYNFKDKQSAINYIEDESYDFDNIRIFECFKKLELQKSKPIIVDITKNIDFED